MTNTNSNVYASNVAANAITKLSGALAAVGYKAAAIKTVVDFCRNAAEVDRRYREANGGGRVMQSVSYSRRGKVHREIRGVDFFAVAIRKAVWNAKKVADGQSWSVHCIVDNDGALYILQAIGGAGSFRKIERTYDNTFASQEVDAPDLETVAAILVASNNGVCSTL